MERSKTKHYEIIGVDCELTSEIIRKCESAYNKNLRFFGKPTQFFKIYLVDGEKEFKRRCGKLYGPNVKGIARIGKKVVSRTQSSIDRSYKKHGGTADFGMMLAHEIAHIFEYHLNHYRGPFWILDSLAMHVAGQIPGKTYVGGRKISREKARTLIYYRHIDSKWCSEIYPIYYSLLSYLIKSFGKEKVVGFLFQFPKNMKKKDFEKTFNKIYGMTYDSFINEFIEKAPWLK